jgi:hypothetical protein
VIAHACPRCGASTSSPGRCTACRPRATREQNRRKNERPTRTVYGSKRWRALRERILRRDNHTCQLCGQRGTVAGHIKPFADYRDPLAWDTANLRCECLVCGGREAGKRGNPKHRGTVSA